MRVNGPGMGHVFRRGRCRSRGPSSAPSGHLLNCVRHAICAFLDGPLGAVKWQVDDPNATIAADPPPGPLQGQRLVQPLLKSFERLHDVGTERDHAGNRKLFYDQYVALLLMYFCNPALDSLRALQQATGWERTRQKLGIERAALGSLSEAARVFDAEALRPIIQELAAQAVPLTTGRQAEALEGLTAVDGSIFAALSRMAWALWQDDAHRGVKLHLHLRRAQGRPRRCDRDAGGLFRAGRLGGRAAARAALRPRSRLRRLRVVRHDRRGRTRRSSPASRTTPPSSSRRSAP